MCKAPPLQVIYPICQIKEAEDALKKVAEGSKEMKKDKRSQVNSILPCGTLQKSSSVQGSKPRSLAFQKFP